MYSYKLNNSYTVYVNWSYYAEAKKATDKYMAKKNGTAVKTKTAAKHSVTKETQQGPAHAEPKEKRRKMYKLPRGVWVDSRTFGRGRIEYTDSNDVVSIKFDDGIHRFQYPDAFNQGHRKNHTNHTNHT